MLLEARGSLTWQIKRNWIPLATVSAVVVFLYLFSTGALFGTHQRNQRLQSPSPSSNPNYEHYGWNEFLPEDSNQNMDLDLNSGLSVDPIYANSEEEVGLDDPPAHLHSYKWSTAEEVPETRVFAHVPGHTVLHNVFSLDGVFYFVSERKRSIPPLRYILSSWADLPGGKILVTPPTEANVRVINKVTAMRLFGTAARFIRGTTWWNNDPLPYVDDSTILHFARTHHMQSHQLHFNMSLLPPDRIFYPQISDQIQKFASQMPSSSLFTSNKPDLQMVLETGIPKVYDISDLANLPGLASIPRLLFPEIGVEFLEDCNDYSLPGRPVLFEALILIDSAASVRDPKHEQESMSTSTSTVTKREDLDALEQAERTRARLEKGSPLAPFRLLDADWWAVWRLRMAEVIGVGLGSEGDPSSNSKDPRVAKGSKSSSDLVLVRTKPVITYISRQGELLGALNVADHEAFVTELEGLVGRQGYEIHVVSPSRLTYIERVSIALQSTIIVGPTGAGLMDVMWMRPSSSTLLVEIFPEDYVTSRHHMVAKTVGVNYLAWRGSRPFVPTMIDGDSIKRDGYDHDGHYASEINRRTILTTNVYTPLRTPINVNHTALCNELVERLKANHSHDEDM